MTTEAKKQARAKKVREQKAKARKAREAKKKAGTAKADLSKQKVNMEQLQRLHIFMQQQIDGFKKEVTESLTQTHQNHQELKGGLDSAEFNLRAHQKVLNALSLDLKRLFKVVDAMATDINQLKVEMQGENAEQYKSITMDSTVMAQHGEGENVTYRIDWPFYHKQVDTDLKEIARIEEETRKAHEAKMEEMRKAQEEEKRQKEIEEMKAKAVEAGNDPEEVEKAANELLDQTKAVSEELGKKMRGEEHDQSVIDEAQKMIDDDEKKHPDGATIFGG
jgi:hypothetical protein